MTDVRLTSSTPAHESQIVELGHLVLHHRRTVAQLGAIVLIISRPHRHHRSVHDVAQGHHLEGNWQCLVRSPVGRQDGADEERTTGADQFAGMFGEEVAQCPFRQDVGCHFCVGLV